MTLCSKLCVQQWLNRSRCRLVVDSYVDPIGSMYTILYRCGSRSPYPKRRGNFLGERPCPGMPDNTLLWAVLKWLNRSKIQDTPFDCELDTCMGRIEALYRPLHAGATRRYIKPSVCGGHAAFLSNYFDHLLLISNMPSLLYYKSSSFIYFFKNKMRRDSTSLAPLIELHIVAQKLAPFLYALTSSNINRFSKFFYYQNQEKICNNTITKDPIIL